MKYAAASAILALFGCAAGPASAQSLEDVVRRSLDYHPVIKSAIARKTSNDERANVERGALFPTVNFRGSTGYQYTDSPGTRNRIRPPGSDRFASLWRNEAGLFVTQLLWDGFLTQNTVNQARANALAAGIRIDDAREQTALQATAAYIDILRNREFVRIAQTNVLRHGAIFGGIIQQSRQGRATEADVSQARSRSALAEANLRLRTGQLREAEVRFEETVGGKAEPAAMRLPGLPPNLAAINVAEYTDKAQTQSHEVRARDAEARAREFGHRATAGLFHPRLEGEISARAGNNLEGVRGHDVDLRALLVVTWNLYRGGADTARRRETLANLVAARHDADDARRAARERVRLAYEALQYNRARLVPLNQRLQAAQATVVQYARQFEAGQRSLLDRLDAQNELFIAQAEYADALHTSVFNYYSLLAAAAELVSSLGIR